MIEVRDDPVKSIEVQEAELAAVPTAFVSASIHRCHEGSVNGVLGVGAGAKIAVVIMQHPHQQR
jgi:hypothetical protein